VGVGAVLEEENPFFAAISGDLLHLEGDVPPDVDQPAGLRAIPLGLGDEILIRHAQIGPVAVHELDPPAGLKHRKGGGHEGVGGAEHHLVPDVHIPEGREGRAAPAGGGYRGKPVPFPPEPLELIGEGALAPPLRGEDRLPHPEQALLVAGVKPDGESASRRL